MIVNSHKHDRFWKNISDRKPERIFSQMKIPAYFGWAGVNNLTYGYLGPIASNALCLYTLDHSNHN